MWWSLAKSLIELVKEGILRILISDIGRGISNNYCHLVVLVEKMGRQQSVAQRCPADEALMEGLLDGKCHSVKACPSLGATPDVAMVICCCFAVALLSNFTEPCQGDVIAAELSGQQSESSGAKERLDIPCGNTSPTTKIDPDSRASRGQAGVHYRVGLSGFFLWSVS